jgi:hypothetical protein
MIERMNPGIERRNGASGSENLAARMKHLSASTTAADMARFMIAHLQDGQFENAQILQSETARMMHSPQFVAVSPLNSMCLGFYEETRNGQRIIGHGGDTGWFHSDLHLMPAANVGFFVSYNSAGKGQINARAAVWEKFLDRYFPYQVPDAATASTSTEDARLVSGSYLSSRRPETTILSFVSTVGVPKVSTNSDGTISTGDRDVSGQPKHFREIAPLVFREVNGQSRVAFKKDSSGRMIMGMDYPFMVLQQAPWDESGVFNYIVIFGCLGVLVLTVVLWPVGVLVRWHYARPLKPARRALRLLVRIVCLVDVAFARAWIGMLSALSDPGKLNDSLDPLLRLVQIVGWLGVIGTVAALYDAWLAMRETNRWWFSRLHAAAIALACVGFGWFLSHWHMLHFSLKYCRQRSLRSRNSSAAFTLTIQCLNHRKSWTSSGKINSSNSTPCLRNASARITVWLNATLRSSSPWISNTGDFQVLMLAMGEDSNARRF